MSSRACRLWMLALAALATAAFAAQQLDLSSHRRQPRYDEVHYISVARDYHRMGGAIAVVRCHLEGRCLEDNRYPTHEMLLQAFAHDRPGFYADAKLVTLGTALLLFAVVLVVTWRAFSPAVGAISVALLALMPTLGEVSSGVLADVLYAAVLFVCVHAVGVSLPRGPWAWAGAGALVGLAYLTKGNAHLALLGLVTAGWALHGRASFRPIRLLSVVGAVAGFVAVAFFLLFRNAKVYGNPFHNFNDRPLWLDGWEQTWRLMRDPEWERIGLRWYLERHSIFALGLRVAKGAGQVIGVLLYTSGLGVSAATPIEQLPTAGAVVVRVATGIAVATLAARGLVSRLGSGRRAEVLAVVHVSFWVLLAFAIGGQGVGGVATRFMLPISVLLVPYAAHAMVTDVVPWIVTRLRWARRAPADTAMLILLIGLAAPLTAKLAWFHSGLASNPRRAFTVPEDWAETSSWFARHLAPGERYAFPHTSLYSTWDEPSPDPDARWVYLYSVEAKEMLRVLAEAKPLSIAPRWDGQPRPITKIFFDAQAKAIEAYRDKLSPEHDEHGPLAFLGWPRCFADSGRPSHFLVFCRAGP